MGCTIEELKRRFPDAIHIEPPKEFAKNWDCGDEPAHDPRTGEFYSPDWIAWCARRFVEQGAPSTVYLESGRPVNCKPSKTVEGYISQLETEIAIYHITGV